MENAKLTRLAAKRGSKAKTGRNSEAPVRDVTDQRAADVLRVTREVLAREHERRAAIEASLVLEARGRVLRPRPSRQRYAVTPTAVASARACEDLESPSDGAGVARLRRVQTSRCFAIFLGLAACSSSGGAEQADASQDAAHRPRDGAPMADARMADAPFDAPSGMYMGPSDGNRCSEDLWCPVEPAIPATLRAMTGTGSNDLWAVGEAGTLLHWNGTNLTRVPVNSHGDIADVYAAAPNDVWAIGLPHALYHFDGSAWSTVAVSTFNSMPIRMSGHGASTIWTLEFGGRTHRYDGSTWTSFTLPVSSSVYMYTIWVAGPDDVWAGGGSNSLFHFDGASWNAVTSPSSDASNTFVGIWGAASNDVWFTNGSTAWHWNGSTFTTGSGSLSYGGFVEPLWGLASNDVWSPGGNGYLDHYDGTTWAHVNVNLASTSYSPSGLSGFSATASDVWFTSIYGGLVHGDGASSWSWVSQPASFSNRKAIWSAATSDVWAVGDGNARHYDGTAWADRTLPGHATLNAVFGLSPTNIYAAGDNGTILHYDGTSWSTVAGIPTTTWHMYAIWASSASDVYVIGYLGNLSHYDGSTWTSMHSGATLNHVYGLYGFGANNIWGATENGGVIHKTASGWTQSTVSPYHLYAIWGAAANDIWTAGFNGYVYHYNGTSWSEVVTPAKADYAAITAIRGRAANDIYMTGGNGRVYHYDGTTWSRQLSGTSSVTHGIAFSGAKTFIVGDSSTIISQH
jgi:hypothetical protein